MKTITSNHKPLDICIVMTLGKYLFSNILFRSGTTSVSLLISLDLQKIGSLFKYLLSQEKICKTKCECLDSNCSKKKSVEWWMFSWPINLPQVSQVPGQSFAYFSLFDYQKNCTVIPTPQKVSTGFTCTLSIRTSIIM